MGRRCRGSHRAKRNRKGVLQPERVRPALGYCLLLGKAGQRDSVWGCGFAAESDPTPQAVEGEVALWPGPCGLAQVWLHGEAGTACIALPAELLQGLGSVFQLCPFPAASTPRARMGWGGEGGIATCSLQQGLNTWLLSTAGMLGGEPGLGLRGDQSIFCSGVPSDHCATPGTAGFGQG